MKEKEETKKYLMAWFKECCEDINIKKSKPISTDHVFTCDYDPEVILPKLISSSAQKTLVYGSEYRIDISIDESTELEELFNKSLQIYYSNFFRSKLSNPEIAESTVKDYHNFTRESIG